MKSSSNKVKPTDRVWGYSREQLMKEIELLRDELDRRRADKVFLTKRLLKVAGVECPTEFTKDNP